MLGAFLCVWLVVDAPDWSVVVDEFVLLGALAAFFRVAIMIFIFALSCLVLIVAYSKSQGSIRARFLS